MSNTKIKKTESWIEWNPFAFMFSFFSKYFANFAQKNSLKSLIHKMSKGISTGTSLLMKKKIQKKGI